MLDLAKVRGYREGENPARWRGHLEKLLPSKRKVRRVEHLAALPYAELPAFMVEVRELREREAIAARALEFTILTAARTGEVRFAEWREFDLAAGVWTVPGARMKAGREHRVPLPERASEVLERLPRNASSAIVFPRLRALQIGDRNDSEMYRRREVEELIGRKRSALYEDIKNGTFLAPVKIGTRAVAWLEADLRAWQANRVAERDHAKGRA